MKQPSPATYMLASPPAVIGAWGTLGWLIYQWTQNGDVWPLVVIAACLVPTVMKADASVQAYTRWKREWDGLDSVAPRRTVPNRHVIGVAVTIGAILLLTGLPTPVQHAAALIGTGAGLIALGASVLRRARAALHRRSDAKAPVVTICVRQPVFAVPTLRDAYHALPDHCLRMG